MSAMSDFDPIAYIKEAGGAFKFGSGVLGRSSVALGVLLVAVIVGAARLHSDWAIFGMVALGAVIFFVWFIKVLKFAREHPDVTVLEGGEWSSYQRFQAAAKGFIPGPDDRTATALPAATQDVLPSGGEGENL